MMSFGTTQNLFINTSHALTTTAPAFLGVNIDAASQYQHTRLNLTDSDLLFLGHKLSHAAAIPMPLRVGGSSSDDLRLSTDTNASHGEITLDLPYFDQLLAFARRCNFDLVWDFNGMRMRSPDGATWNSTSARVLLERTLQQRSPLWGVQLGNEPGHFQTRNGDPTPEAHSADFRALSMLLDDLFDGKTNVTKRPRIQGPDICNGHGTPTSPCANLTYLRRLLLTAGADTLDDLTVHGYGLTGPGKPDTQCQLSDFLQPALWEQQLLPNLVAWDTERRRLAPYARLVWSETATAADAGCPGLSNRFAAGFFFVSALGALGEAGAWQVYRQDLVGYSGIKLGSSYAMLGPAGWYSRATHGVLKPHPDFFTALLWRSLVGSTRLSVSISVSWVGSRSTTHSLAAMGVRWHAACAVGGGVVVAYINPTSYEVSVTLNGGAGKLPVREVRGELHLYLLTAPAGNLTADAIQLNGVLLNATSPLDPLSIDRHSPVATPLFSYGFIVDRAAHAPACSTSRSARSEVKRAPQGDGHGGFSAACLDPRDFGAREGNPGGSAGPYWRSNTKAIQAALDAAPSHAASCVEVSGGDFVTADLFVRSGTRFSVSTGARLLSAINQTQTSLLNVWNATNVSVGGGGTLYGNAEYYEAFFQPVDNRFEPRFPDGRRPHLLLIDRSKRVVVSDLLLRNCSDWNVWIKASENVTVQGLDVRGDSRFPNNDGIEVDSSLDVRILDSHIDVADDGISPISSVENGPLRRLLVRNTSIRSKSHAIKFGSTCEAECSDCTFENLTIFDSNSGLAIQQRGAGDIYNISFRDISIETRYAAPRWWGNGEWLAITVEARNSGDQVGRLFSLSFRHIRVRAENGGLLSGRAGEGVSNVSFQDVNVTITTGVGNYSSGDGPPCFVLGRNTTCMGTHDHRPSYAEDVNCSLFGNCRTAAHADGLYLENAHSVDLERMHVRFEPAPGSKAPPPQWFGECVRADNQSTAIAQREGSCVHPPAASFLGVI